MSGAPEYLDIYVEDLLDSHKVSFIGLNNEPILTVSHRPWFVAFTPREWSATALRDVLRRELRYVDVEEIRDAIPLIYDEGQLSYEPATRRVYQVSVANRKDVPRAQSLLESYDLKTGLSNIRYEVRVAYDFSDRVKFLGLDTPLLFRSTDEMIKGMEAALGKVSQLKVMAIDIEVFSRHGGFPAKGDPILTITYSTFKMSDDIFSPTWLENKVHVLSQPKTEDTNRLVVNTADLVQELGRTIERESPNIVVTYNGLAFDLPYMEPFVGEMSNIALHGATIVARRGKSRILIPHIDLMLVRDSMGSAMGVRSQSAYALDDVALEVAAHLGEQYDLSWLPGSKYIEAERKLNHARLRDYWLSDDPLFEAYIKADVYLTSLIARAWLYPLYLLSAVVGIPPSVLQTLNTGQIAEYMLVEYLRRLGFYPELRKRREYTFGRVEKAINAEGAWVFNKGKVYVKDYGVFGGNDKYVVELDFAQLYPTDMSVNAVDPTSLFVADYVVGRGRPTLKLDGYRAAGSPTLILLTKGGEGQEGTVVAKVVHGYGPISWLIYKAYSARWETKKLKARAKSEHRPELAYPDQAIKIVNNSIYGSFSKTRGNLVSEATSASVFWRTLRMLYEIVSYVEGGLSKKLGAELKVIYGDTDSAFILAPRSLAPDVIVKEVNSYIKSRYGKLYEMELEDTYDFMIVPKQKGVESPSAKSYIAVKNCAPAKIRGEFFKVEAPMVIKDNLDEFYAELLRRWPKKKEEVRELVRKFIEPSDVHTWFIKKSVSSFVNEDDPTKLKKLNKPFQYAALFSLWRFRTPGVTEVSTSPLAAYLPDAKGRQTVTIRVEPRVVESQQRAVVVYYLPSFASPKKFYFYVGDNGREVTFDYVEVLDSKVVRHTRPGAPSEAAEERYYDVTFRFKEDTMPKELFLERVIQAVEARVIDVLYDKLIEAMNRSGWVPSGCGQQDGGENI